MPGQGVHICLERLSQLPPDLLEAAVPDCYTYLAGAFMNRKTGLLLLHWAVDCAVARPLAGGIIEVTLPSAQTNFTLVPMHYHLVRDGNGLLIGSHPLFCLDCTRMSGESRGVRTGPHGQKEMVVRCEICKREWYPATNYPVIGGMGSGFGSVSPVRFADPCSPGPLV